MIIINNWVLFVISCIGIRWRVGWKRNQHFNIWYCEVLDSAQSTSGKWYRGYMCFKIILTYIEDKFRSTLLTKISDNCNFRQKLSKHKPFQNFRHPKYLQYSMKLLNSTKGVSFLYRPFNSSLDKACNT